MWTFFEDGTFYSTVVDKHDKTLLWVRSRDRRSAEIFSNWLGDDTREIVELKGRDYDFRVEVSRAEWVEFLRLQGEKMQATNFKNEVARNVGYQAGKPFLDALHDIWAVMWDYQAKGRKAKATVTKKAPATR